MCPIGAWPPPLRLVRPLRVSCAPAPPPNSRFHVSRPKPWCFPFSELRRGVAWLGGGACCRRAICVRAGRCCCRRRVPGGPPSPLFTLSSCLPFWSSRPYSPPRNPQMLALLCLPHPPRARSSRVPPSPLRPPPARLAALPATVPGWVGPLSGGGGVRVLDLPLPPTGMLAALGLAIRRPSPPSPPLRPTAP